MNRIALATSAFALSTTMAIAGSLAPAPVEPVVYTPAPIARHNWTGGYVGLSLNYGRSSHTPDVAGQILPDASGFGGGALAGYNWQNGDAVFGVEVAGNVTNMDGEDECANAAWDCTSQISNVISARLRGGIAMDRTLLFATAGVASAGIRHQAINAAGTVFEDSHRANGLVVGVGIEHAFAGGWSLRGDLEHYRFSRRDYALDVDYIQVRPTMNMARISAVWRF